MSNKEQKPLDLFTIPEMTVKSRTTRVIRYDIYINGEKYDLDNLYETIEELGDIYFPERERDRVAKLLYDLHVITDYGSGRWCSPASKGDNYEKFYQQVCDLYYDAHGYNHNGMLDNESKIDRSDEEVIT